MTSATAPQNCLTLSNGAWVVQDDPDRTKRPYLGDYQAFLTRLTGITVLASWNGPSLPIAVATGIGAVSTTESGQQEYYTLDGRKVSTPNGQGVYIRVKDGKATKMVRSRR